MTAPGLGDARPDGAAEDPQARIAALEARIARLEKINAVLMDRVESSFDGRADAFSLFQTTIALERQVRARTDELTAALRRLESVNEELLRAKDRAERADHSKTRFLAQAGHDLLQPLAAARLSSAALAGLQREADGQRLTRQIDRGLATIEGLLKTLLDISRLDAGIMIPAVETVSLAEVLPDLAADFAPVARRRGLRFDVIASSIHVATDPIMLTRILHNLIGNALRYTESGRVLVGARRRGERVRIDVIDTGPGIADDQRTAVFEEFHRGRGRVPDGEVGLGLGLSIVRRLADVLHHPIELQSRPGAGSRFSVEIDRVDEAAAPLRVPAPPIPTPQEGGVVGALVAIVDNDEAVRGAMVDLVERWGCVVVSAADAAGVIAAVDEGGRFPDLMLVDYHLDEETAVEAIAAMRAQWGADRPAIVVTGDHGRAVAERLAAGGLEAMRKPVRPAELRALMAHMLAREEARRAEAVSAADRSRRDPPAVR